MNATSTPAAPATEVHPEIALTACPHCGAEGFQTEKRITVVGKIAIGMGAIAVLASLALTFLYVGLFTLIPSALLIWAGTMVREEVNICGDCHHEF